MARVGHDADDAPTMRVAILLLVPLFAACSNQPPAPPLPPGEPSPPAPTAPPTSAPTPTGRLSFEGARARFQNRGVQPGQKLPPLSLVDLDGKPFDLAALQRGRPLVLVTVSLTCNVARRNQAAVGELARALGDRAAVLTIYTIDAHPITDACPYTGEEWVPEANHRDAVLVRQPTDLAARLDLARRYAHDWQRGAGSSAVDTIDNASWHTLGEAPNVGLVVDRDGVVTERTGWFDGDKLRAACERLAR